MRGVVLAGGNGRRLGDLTEVTNKHLLAVYDKPMVFFPLQTLLDCGIHDILIVSGRDRVGGFLSLLGSGRKFDANFTYRVQDEAGGIAEALALAEDFARGDNIAVVLGDNIFEDDLAPFVRDFEGRKGAHIFLKHVADANRFGVAEIDGDRVISIEEKPAMPKSSYAVSGFYLYDSRVFELIRNLKPSGRGELEITDVNNAYIARGEMTATLLTGDWTDAGTFESLHHANVLARKIELERAAKRIASQKTPSRRKGQLLDDRLTGELPSERDRTTSPLYTGRSPMA
jgi:glucose-1-phosphate thymidylyltransferase